MLKCVLQKKCHSLEIMDNSTWDREDADTVKDRKSGNSLKELLEGRIVADKFKRNGWFVLFITMLGIWYISNGYSMEKLHRERSALESEVRDLRFESITAAANLMFIRKQSEVIKRIKEEGLSLEESKEPPMKLYK